MSKKSDQDIIAEGMLDRANIDFITRNARPEHLSGKTLRDSAAHLKTHHDDQAESRHSTPEEKEHHATASKLLQAYLDHVAKSDK